MNKEKNQNGKDKILTLLNRSITQKIVKVPENGGYEAHWLFWVLIALSLLLAISALVLALMSL